MELQYPDLPVHSEKVDTQTNPNHLCPNAQNTRFLYACIQDVNNNHKINIEITQNLIINIHIIRVSLHHKKQRCVINFQKKLKLILYMKLWT